MAGARLGMEKGSGTRSGLLWEVERLFTELMQIKDGKNHLPDVLLMENVPQVLTAEGWKEWVYFLESIGYTNFCQVLNAKDYGIPQNRDRAFMLSIRDIGGGQTYNFPKPFELKIRLKDLLETDVDEKYYLSPKMIKYMMADNQKWTGNNGQSLINKEIASTINTGEVTRRCDASNYVSDELPNMFDIKAMNVGGKPTFDRQSRFLSNVGNGNKEIANTITTLEGNRPVSTFIFDEEDNKHIVELKRGYSVEVKDEAEQSDEVDVIGNYSKSGYGQTAIIGKNGLTPTITENHGQVVAIVKESIRIRTANKQGYMEAKEGDGVDTSTRMATHRGTAQDQISHTLTGNSNDNGVVVKGISNLRIRKLTCRECFRLMGVKNTDFNKLSASNNQLYKQAGNSIVVAVLMAIYSPLFDIDYQAKIEELIKELKG